MIVDCIMLISACHIQGDLLILPNNNQVLGIRKVPYSSSTENISYFKKFVGSLDWAASALVSDSSTTYRLNITDYDKNGTSMSIINSSHLIMGQKLTIVHYGTTMGSRMLINSSYNSIYFEHVICIDASTCIASDRSQQMYRYYKLRPFMEGNNYVDKVDVKNEDHDGIIGLSSTPNLGMVFICSYNKCYTRHISGIVFAVEFSTDWMRGIVVQKPIGDDKTRILAVNYGRRLLTRITNDVLLAFLAYFLCCKSNVQTRPSEW